MTENTILEVPYIPISSHSNPFNPATTITFTLAEPGDIHLTVYDNTGRNVAELVDGVLPVGRYEAAFDGAWLASGVYLPRLESGGRVTTGKMLLMK